MSDKTSRIFTGGCLCGAVRYEADGQPLVVAHCHCENCQRGSGAGHSTGAMFPASAFRMTGKVAEYKLKSAKGNEVTRVFCPVCGSPILGRNNGMEGFATIGLGTLDHSADINPQVVVFARNRKPWDIMDQDLPTFDSQPNWKPGDGV